MHPKLCTFWVHFYSNEYKYLISFIPHTKRRNLTISPERDYFVAYSAAVSPQILPPVRAVINVTPSTSGYELL